MSAFVVSNDRTDGGPNVPNAVATTKWKSYLWRRNRASSSGESTVLYGWDDTGTSDSTYLKWKPIGQFISASTLTQLVAGSTKISLTLQEDGNLYFDVVDANISAAYLLNREISSTAPSDDDVYMWSSSTSKWTPYDIKAWVTTQIITEDTLEELNDTDISSVAAGQVIVYDGSNSWDNTTISGDATLASNGAFTLAAINTNLTTLANLTTVGTLASPTLTSPVLNTGVSGTAILSNIDISHSDNTTLGSAKSIKTYVDAQVDTVDTLAEILANGNTSGGTDLVLSTGDSLGIGTAGSISHLLTLEATSSPSHLKILNKSTQSAGQGAGILLASDDGVAMGNGNKIGSIDFQGAEDASSTMRTAASIQVFADADWGGAENGGRIEFLTNDAANAYSTRMKITSDGYVGIGCTPGTQLSVGNSVCQTQIYTSTTASYLLNDTDDKDINYEVTGTGGHYFATAGSPRLTIEDDGDVKIHQRLGVGATPSTHALEVTGTAYARTTATAANNYGVYGQSIGAGATNLGGYFHGLNAATNYGVFAQTGASTGTSYAGNFNAGGAVGGNSYGVYCNTTATNDEGAHYGVSGKSILVDATNTRANYGGYFEAAGAKNNTGVHAKCGDATTTGTLYGTYSEIASTVDDSAATGVGLYGICAGSPDYGYGVFGKVTGACATRTFGSWGQTTSTAVTHTSYGGYFDAAGGTSANYGISASAEGSAAFNAAATFKAGGATTNIAIQTRGGDVTLGDNASGATKFVFDAANGSVGIGQATASTHTLEVAGEVYAITTADGGYGVYGISGEAGTTGTLIGVRGTIPGGVNTGNVYGVYGDCQGAAGGTGVYGGATGAGTTNYGGFFDANGATNNYGIFAQTTANGGIAGQIQSGNAASTGALFGLKAIIAPAVDSATSGYAIEAHCAGAPETGYGVYGSATGLVGDSDASTTTNYGGFFTATGATNNIGIRINCATGTISRAIDTRGGDVLFNNDAGQGKFIFDASTGLVGIGKSTVTTYALEVAGEAEITSTGAGGILNVANSQGGCWMGMDTTSAYIQVTDAGANDWLRIVSGTNGPVLRLQSSVGNWTGGMDSAGGYIQTSTGQPFRIVADNTTALLAATDGTIDLPESKLTLDDGDSGTDGQVLTTDGSGGVAWENIAGGSAVMAIGSNITNSTSGAVLFADSSNSLGEEPTKFFWDEDEFRLGIGTNVPARTLSLVGSGIVGLLIDNPTTANPFIELDDGTDVWYNQIASSKYMISKGGNNHLIIDSSGSVGIGRTPTVHALEVEGKIHSTTGYLTANNQQIGWRNAGNTANHDWLLNASDVLQYRSGGTPVFHITDAGLVGIGTESPGATLGVVGSIHSFASSTTPGSDAGWQFGASNANKDGYLWNFEEAGIVFGTDGEERMSIATLGDVKIEENLGVGGTPDTNLHLIGGAVKQLLRIENSSGRSDMGVSGGGSDILSTDSAGDFVLTNYNGGDLLFGTATTEHMRIGSDGSVGIGTESAQTNLHIFETEGSVGDKDATITLGGYLTQGATIASWRDIGDSNSRGLVFSTRETGVGMVDAITITGPGLVGIGPDAANASTALNVSVAHVASTIVPALKISTTGGYNPAAGSSIDFGLDQDSYATWVAGRIAGVRGSGSYGGKLEFYTNKTATPTDLGLSMTIEEDGDVKIEENLGVGGEPVDTNSFGRAIDIMSSTGAAVYLRDTGGTKTGILGQYDEQLTLNSRQADGTVGLLINDSPKLTVASDGDVKIEENLSVGGTLASGAKLSTIGTGNQVIKFECTDNNHVRIEMDADRSAGNVLGKLDGLWNGTTVTEIKTVAGANDESDGHLTFHTLENGGTIAERMRITSVGNIGIGSAIPTKHLDIFEDTDNDDSEVELRISSEVVASGVLGDQFAARISTAKTSGGVPYSKLKGPKDAVGWLAFTTGLSDDERMRITADGALGLGGANYGTSGQVLTSAGSSDVPTWANAVSANLTGHITSTGNATILGSFTVAELSAALSDVTLSGSNSGDQTTVSGNAGTATVLAAGKTIAMTGDVVWTSASFTGAGNVTGTSVIQAGAVDVAMLSATNTADATVFLRGDNTWQAASGAVSAVANGADNRIATFSSGDALYGEANLTFDGSTLAVSGDLTLDQTITFDYRSGPGAANFIDVADASGMDINGTGLVINGGAGTGAGVGGVISFKVAPSGSLGTNVNAHEISLTLENDKSATFYGGVDVAGNLTLDQTITFERNSSDNQIKIADAVGTDITGTSLSLHAGAGTGSGDGGGFYIDVAPAGSTGSTANALATAFAISQDKNAELFGSLYVKGSLTIEDGPITPHGVFSTDDPGRDMTLQGGAGRGDGAGGDIILQVAPAGSAGGGVNAHATALTITEDKEATFVGGVTAPTFTGALDDADGDTKIQVEESTDEDTIRFDVDGSEAMVMYSTKAIEIKGSSYSNITTLTSSSGNILIDFHSNNYKHTMTEDTALDITRFAIGQSGCIVITQDDLGSGFTMDLSSSYWVFEGGAVPALSTAADAVDTIAYYVPDGGTVQAVLLKDFS